MPPSVFSLETKANSDAISQIRETHDLVHESSRSFWSSSELLSILSSPRLIPELLFTCSVNIMPSAIIA